MLVNEGEKSDDQVRQHARDWIAANQAQWDSWIAEAGTAQ